MREVYSQCGDDDCQKTCNTGLIRPDCNTNCNPGCICMAGYLRNHRGHCVRPDDCGNWNCSIKFEPIRQILNIIFPLYLYPLNNEIILNFLTKKNQNMKN